MMTATHDGVTYREGVVYRDADGDLWTLVRDDPTSVPDGIPASVFLLRPSWVAVVAEGFGPLTEVPASVARNGV
jgi:hypothetical protein